MHNGMRQKRPNCRTKDKLSHAQKRAEQRYGITLSFREISDIVERIEAGDYLRCADEGMFTCQVLIEVFGQRMLLIYHKTGRKILTFLPLPEWAERYQTFDRARHLFKPSAKAA